MSAEGSFKGAAPSAAAAPSGSRNSNLNNNNNNNNNSASSSFLQRPSHGSDGSGGGGGERRRSYLAPPAGARTPPEHANPLAETDDATARTDTVDSSTAHRHRKRKSGSGSGNGTSGTAAAPREKPSRQRRSSPTPPASHNDPASLQTPPPPPMPPSAAAEDVEEPERRKRKKKRSRASDEDGATDATDRSSAAPAGDEAAGRKAAAGDATRPNSDAQPLPPPKTTTAPEAEAEEVVSVDDMEGHTTPLRQESVADIPGGSSGDYPVTRPRRQSAPPQSQDGDADDGAPSAAASMMTTTTLDGRRMRLMGAAEAVGDESPAPLLPPSAQSSRGTNAGGGGGGGMAASPLPLGTPLRPSVAPTESSSFVAPHDISARVELYSPAEGGGNSGGGSPLRRPLPTTTSSLPRTAAAAANGNGNGGLPPLPRAGFVAHESGGRRATSSGKHSARRADRPVPPTLTHTESIGRRHGGGTIHREAAPAERGENTNERSAAAGGGGPLSIEAVNGAAGGDDDDGRDGPGTPQLGDEMEEVASRTKGSQRAGSTALHASDQGGSAFNFSTPSGGDSGDDSDEEGTRRRALLPLFSCMEKRDDPNDWKMNRPRRHAFERPLHLFQSIAFVLTMLGVIFHFTAVVPATVVLYRAGHRALPEMICFTVIGAVGTCSVLTSWLIVSFRDNGDHANVGGLCCYCRVKTAVTSKHCKACNKCVTEFDHHCKWLNMCIGGKNYKIFMWYVASAVIFMTYAIVAAIAVLAKWWGELGAFSAYYRVGPILLIVIMAIGMPPIAHLFGFHIMLNIKGLSTYEYIINKREGKMNRPAVAGPRRKKFPCCCCKEE